MDKIRLITTADGSHSLEHSGLNETYHSIHGAIRESQHVFIKNGLEYFVSRSGGVIDILEVGFGTGLNALLTLRQVLEKGLNVNYTTIEAYPLESDIWSKLNYTASLGLQEYFEALHQATPDTVNTIVPGFRLLKLFALLEQVDLEGHMFDVMYYDAFAPNKQPEMWTLPMLKKVTDRLKNGGVWVTYSAKGSLKRDLKALGLSVETLPGPPGKKEMIRAVKTPAIS